MVFKVPFNPNHPRILWMICLRNKTHWCGQLLHSQKEPPCSELAQEHIPAAAGDDAHSSNTPSAPGSAGTQSIHHSHFMSWSPHRTCEQLLPSC